MYGNGCETLAILVLTESNLYCTVVNACGELFQTTFIFSGSSGTGMRVHDDGCMAACWQVCMDIMLDG